MKDKRFLWLIILVFIFSVCHQSPESVEVVDLQIASGFTGEAIEGGCLIYFKVINLGQKTAKNVFVILELWDLTNDIKLSEHKIYLGDISPGQVVDCQLELPGVEWGSNIGFKTKFVWD